MTKPDWPVTEEELHAYVDGELQADRREAVASWLAEHPNEAATVAAWRAQAEAIRARYGDVAEEPVPERLKLEQVLRDDRGRGWKAIAAAAAVVLFIVGGGAGWFARDLTIPPYRHHDATITADALQAYRLYVVEVRHPVEVPGSERPHLTQWLSKRLGYEQRIPDLSAAGLKLVGGRLLPGPSGAAAFYMYEGPSGERYTLYCAKVGGPETGLRFEGGKQSAAISWVDDKVGYVVAGPDQRERLEQITKLIYDQIDKSERKS